MKQRKASYSAIILSAIVILAIVFGAAFLPKGGNLLGTSAQLPQDEINEMRTKLEGFIIEQIIGHHRSVPTIDFFTPYGDYGLIRQDLKNLIYFCQEAFGVNLYYEIVDISITPASIFTLVVNRKYGTNLTVQELCGDPPTQRPSQTPMPTPVPKIIDENTIYQSLINIVENHLGFSLIDDGLNIYTTMKELGADELDIIELIMVCEEEFEIEISGEYDTSINTFADLYTCVVNIKLNKNYTVEELCGQRPSDPATPEPPSTPEPTPQPKPTPVPSPTPEPAQIEDNHDNVQYRMFASSTERIFEISDNGDYYTSELHIIPFDFAPKGTAFCDGRPIPAYQYKDLSDIIGSEFGGNQAMIYLPEINKNGSIPGKNYSMELSSMKPSYSEGDSLFNNYINYVPVDFALSHDYMLGEVILAKGIDEEASEEYVLPCDGRVLHIDENQALFALLSSAYGGDGTSTFALPNFNSTNTPIIGAKYYIRVNGIFPEHDE